MTNSVQTTRTEAGRRGDKPIFLHTIHTGPQTGRRLQSNLIIIEKETQILHLRFTYAVNTLADYDYALEHLSDDSLLKSLLAQCLALGCQPVVTGHKRICLLRDGVPVATITQVG